MEICKEIFRGNSRNEVVHIIRLLELKDMKTVCDIVNDSWKSIYKGYINPELLTDRECAGRANEIESDFLSGRLLNYVYEINGRVVALLSIGDTEDNDKTGAFEIWHIYILKSMRGKGIGKELLVFAEQQAVKMGYNEIVIWAFLENINALTFYKKYGYLEDKQMYLESPYYAHGVRFIKELNK